MSYSNPARQTRSRYARSDVPGSLRVNSPDGYPSGVDPVWWWGTDFISPASPATAMAAVTRATSLIVNTICALPWRLLSGGADAQTSIIELPPPRWMVDPQLHRPDARYGLPSIPAALRLPRAAFWGQWLRSCLLKGMGFLLFEVDGNGAPVAGTFRVLNPDLVAPMWDYGQGFVYRRVGSEHGGGFVDTDFDGQIVLGGRVYRLVELVSPLAQADEYGVARGVLEVHAAELGMAAQEIEFGQGMYRSGVPSGYLKVSTPNYSKPQADALKTQWLANHGGDKRSIAVLNATTEFVPIQMSPVDMALIQSRQMSLVDIANMFGVPVYQLGGTDGGSNTYSSAESRNRDFLSYSLMPWANAVEDELTSLTPQGQFVEVNFGGILKTDTATRYSAYSQALADGWLTVDEVRLLESLPPLDQSEPFAGIDPAIGGAA